MLGGGGMGTVYLAHDLSLDRPVAIKVLRRELGDKPELVERLVLEAQAQARLQHPNVVNVYYIGVFDGTPYFAMEYVRGQTLADQLSERGTLPWQEALEYIIQTTQALLEAHERGIVHRDVKPSNLLLCPAGAGGAVGALAHIKVADFGLAAQSGRQQEHLVGSPYYAAPEQLAGQAPDHRSDIYSLGVTFHELLTGNPPFEADSFGELVHLHATAPRPEIAADRAPWRLRRLITEMMDPAPGRAALELRGAARAPAGIAAARAGGRGRGGAGDGPAGRCSAVRRTGRGLHRRLRHGDQPGRRAGVCPVGGALPGRAPLLGPDPRQAADAPAHSGQHPRGESARFVAALRGDLVGTASRRWG